jgi:glycosyltransferase involved in cell wall biosynthesis
MPHASGWKWLFRRGGVPQVVVHSETMRRVVIRYGQPAARTLLIPLGCDPAIPVHHDRLAVGPAPRIVTMGGLAHSKGHHDALVAIASLRRQARGLCYQIIGEVRDASYRRYLEALKDKLGVRDCVRITPNLPHDEKQRVLAGADLYLQPSHEEGFCLAYIEAAGIVPRLVGTDTGAIRAIGAGDDGARTVPVRRPDLLEAAMRDLLAATLPVDLMAGRAARLATRFAWSRYIDAHEGLYRQASEDMGGTFDVSMPVRRHS